jgi:hypothetical protein
MVKPHFSSLRYWKARPQCLKHLEEILLVHQFDRWKTADFFAHNDGRLEDDLMKKNDENMFDDLNL